MATRSIIISDISGTEVSEDKHAKVLVNHPDSNQLIELDMSTDESDKFVNTTLRLVEFTIHAPNVPPRVALVETKTLDKLFNGVNMDEVFANGRKVSMSVSREQSQAKTRKPRGTAVPKESKRDYKAMENIGIEHRGRVTEEEAKLVRENLEVANANRAREGQPPIDPKDEKMKRRYGF